MRRLTNGREAELGPPASKASKIPRTRSPYKWDGYRTSRPDPQLRKEIVLGLKIEETFCLSLFLLKIR
jgi:hypothetical protein